MNRILYIGTKNASSWALRAWLALREQGIEFEERLIDLRPPQRALDLAKVGDFSPPAAVPVLVDGGTVIFDSLAIMEYASDIGERPLLPADPRKRARARSLLAWMHSGLSGLCGRLSFESSFYPERRAMKPAEAQEAGRLLKVWNDELAASGGPYLAGDLSLADLAFVPVVRRLQAHEADASPWPLAETWMRRLMARPAVAEWMAEAERLPPVWLEDYAAPDLRSPG
ncbi:glutathione S-transferase family protein [Luteimonas gilva]|uniref:Glutathione S-transferase family protein n=1 Tax=Luteimonas gilva TaxID=2572684 RepID=A0A4U5JXH8_9GAMM|nr:glutathione S-transferase family protein [Luteimonas gilva]TKR33886.1 glutathione S-transferase family protein [Luteimonas gilva]